MPGLALFKGDELATIEDGGDDVDKIFRGAIAVLLSPVNSKYFLSIRV